MAGKIGERFVSEMIDRGRRELGGALFPESNIAQPMYPLHGGYGKETAVPTVEAREESVTAEYLAGGGRGLDGPTLDEPEHDRY